MTNNESEIKRLEEELSFLEDENSELRRKLKNKNAEISDLDASVSDYKREVEKLKDDLRNQTLSLVGQQKNFESLDKSLSFVKAILSAPLANSIDYVKRNKIVDSIENLFWSDIYPSIRDYYYTLYCSDDCTPEDKQGYELLVEYHKDRMNEWSAVARKSWLANKTTIAFIGEFSAGKTSIVNRILSYDDPSVPKLPVSVKATTAIPTYIAGGKATRYCFFSPDESLKNLAEDIFKSVDKEVLGNIEGLSSLLKYFVMTYKNEYLNNLSILDTPGFNSNDKDDALRTIEVINECNALFWVVDVNAGELNRTSLKVIKDNLQKPLYIVINKTDTKSKNEVEDVINHIKKTIAREDVAVKDFIAFSKKAPLNTIMEAIKSVDSTKDNEFLKELSVDIKEILKYKRGVLKDVVEKKNKMFKKLEAQKNLLDEYSDDISDNCERVNEIPKPTEHFWSGSYYEMSESDYRRLQNILQFIDDNRYDMISCINDMLDIQKEYLEINDDYHELLNEVNDLQRSFDKIKKLQKEFEEQ